MAKEHVCPTCRTVLPTDPYRSSTIRSTVQKQKWAIISGLKRGARFLLNLQALEQICNVISCIIKIITNAFIGLLAIAFFMFAPFMIGKFLDGHFNLGRIAPLNPVDTWGMGFSVLILSVCIPALGMGIKNAFKRTH